MPPMAAMNVSLLAFNAANRRDRAATGDANKGIAADARQPLAVEEQGIDQSPTGMTRARMHHQARWFVDHQEGVVFVDNLQRQGFGDRMGGTGRGDIHGDDISAPDAITGRHHPLGETNLPPLDEPLQLIP